MVDYAFLEVTARNLRAAARLRTGVSDSFFRAKERSAPDVAGI